MITLKTDGISLVYENTDLKLQRNIRIDKVSGEVRIMEYDTVTGKLNKKISCDVFDLDSFQNIDEYARQAAKELIDR